MLAAAAILRYVFPGQYSALSSEWFFAQLAGHLRSAGHFSSEKGEESPFHTLRPGAPCWWTFYPDLSFPLLVRIIPVNPVLFCFG